MMSVKPFFFWCFTLLLFGCAENTHERSTVEEALASFEIVDGFEIELVASEPDISDPVDIEIDEFGRMYVVEMHGYPLDKDGSGKIKLLRDSDGNGSYDQVSLFAEDLVLPNSVMRWKQGIIVTDAPNVLYLEDTDDDGKADILDTLLTGFALANPQHKLNSPIYGLDNWIYLANEAAYNPKIYKEEFGDRGTAVKYFGEEKGTVLPINADGRRVRIKPDQHLIEVMSTPTQFSQSLDEYGRTFLGNNTSQIYHEAMEAKYMLRNPDLAISSAIQPMSSYGIPADVYPITDKPEHQIFTSVGVFTSACGVTRYLGGAFPEPYDRVAFIGEPVGNLVHVCTVEEDGSSFKANRVYEKKEFLASTDSWFRPVNHYVVPDGSVYLVDYYRRVIEHPEWIGKEVVDAGYLYSGNDQGRIYKINAVNSSTASAKDLRLPGLANDQELVSYLAHGNSWWRMNAQRLLVDHQNKSVVKRLQEMVASDDSGFGRLHAAWTLLGLQSLTEEDVLFLLKDQNAGIRENGIRLAEHFLDSKTVRAALYDLGNDKNTRVLFQLLCTLGYDVGEQAGIVRRKIIFDNINDTWIRNAGLSAQYPDYKKLLEKTMVDFDQDPVSYGAFLEAVVGMYVNHLDPQNVKSLIGRALASGRSSVSWKAPLLKGLAKKQKLFENQKRDFKSERKQLLSKAIDSAIDLELRGACLALLSTMGLPGQAEEQFGVNSFLEQAFDMEAVSEQRVLALELISLVGIEDRNAQLYEMLAPSQPLEVQQKALEVLAKHEGTRITDYLVEHWGSVSPTLRKDAIDVFTENPERIVQLIEALEAGTIEPVTIHFYRQIFLMTQDDEGIRNRARKIFDVESSDKKRKEVIARYSERVDEGGNIAKGKLAFEKNCALCHQIGGKLGSDYGPDLGSMRNRKPHAILTDVLDPGLSIADGFDYWEVTKDDGEIVLGIIESETPTSVVVRETQDKSTIIPRGEILTMKAQGISLMPIGLENTISPDEMTDLISFLRSEK